MDIQERIESDLKTAMLGGDKTTAETLRGLKSAILNETISQNARDTGLNEVQIQKVLSREAKKRTEAAELYRQGGSPERADKELAEKVVIDKYLPEPMGEAEVAKLVDEELAKVPGASQTDMGRIIGAVRSKTGAAADGALIARLVKEKISK